MSEHEQWDIVSSVGFTALLVSAARAVEGHKPGRLVDDPWAARFVEAAKPSSTVPVRPDEHWETDDETPGLAADIEQFWTVMVNYLGVRSRFIDTALDAAVARGVDQVVLLAAGLDARALRLSWGPSVAVYEIDQDAVMTFKDEVIAAHNGTPTADRRVVGVDLRDDWVTALREAGFDPSRRTAWLAEGLLPFLPAAAEETLLRAIDELSAPGSEVVTEQFENVIGMMAGQPAMRTLTARFGVDSTALASVEERTPADRRLTELGWDVHPRRSEDIGREYGREIGVLPGDVPFTSILASGTKS